MTETAPSRSGQFIRRSMLGGLVVLLPIAILALFFRWLYNALSGAIEPLTTILVQNLRLPGPAADALILLLLIVICFAVGHLVSTRIGGWAWSGLERRLPVARRLTPWAAFDGYSRTDDALVLHRPRRVDTRFALADLEDPDAVETALDRYLPASGPRD